MDLNLTPADVIDEEDLEESMGAPSTVKKSNKSPGKVSRNGALSQVKMKTLDAESRNKGQSSLSQQRKNLVSRGSREDTNESKLSKASIKSVNTPKGGKGGVISQVAKKPSTISVERAQKQSLAKKPSELSAVSSKADAQSRSSKQVINAKAHEVLKKSDSPKRKDGPGAAVKP